MVSPLTLLILLHSFSTYRHHQHSNIIYYPKPLFFHGVCIPTFTTEAIFSPGSLEQAKLLLDTLHIYSLMGRDSAVGIATRYALDGPGIESRWGRDFPHPSRPVLGPTKPPVQWVPGFSRGLSGRGVVLTTQPI